MSQSTSVKHVLLCEDEGITVMALRKTLVRSGYVVIGETAEGDVAIALARQLRPDLILMDIGLQGTVSGLEAARAIMEECPVPIILMSGYAEETLKSETFSAGASGYLTKPVTAELLMTAIEEAFLQFGEARGKGKSSAAEGFSQTEARRLGISHLPLPFE